MSRASALTNCDRTGTTLSAPSINCSTGKCWHGTPEAAAENKTQRESRKNVANVVEKNEKKIPTGANSASWERLGDFTATIRLLPISALALGIGALAAVVALALLRLIGLFTNLFYFGRWSTALVSPSGNHLGWFSVFVPIGGALIIGFMARYGSERIRGHGIPEAI